MATVRQIAAYVAECIGEHLRPDALGVKRLTDDTVQLTTRKAGTQADAGEIFLLRIERQVTARTAGEQG